MQYVLSLIGGVGDGDLTDVVVSRARTALEGAGASVDREDWLSPNEAADLPFADLAPDRAVETIRDAFGAMPVDVNVCPATDRRKRLLIADMDSTMIVGESLDELADHAGLKEQIAAITARAMNGELDFEDALKERVALLRGLPVKAVDAVVAELQPTAGAGELVATMKACGAYCALVSGGFKPMTGAIRQRLGFDEDRANVLDVDGETLAGTVGLPILGRDAKLETLHELSGRLGMQTSSVMAVGDGANDLAMIGEAGMGVAFHAKPAVRSAAAYRIDHSDLRGLLYLQGFRSSEIVSPA